MGSDRLSAGEDSEFVDIDAVGKIIPIWDTVRTVACLGKTLDTPAAVLVVVTSTG